MDSDQLVGNNELSLRQVTHFTKEFEPGGIPHTLLGFICIRLCLWYIWYTCSIYWCIYSIYWYIYSIYWYIYSIYWYIYSIYWYIYSIYWYIYSIYWCIYSIYWNGR